MMIPIDAITIVTPHGRYERALRNRKEVLPCDHRTAMDEIAWQRDTKTPGDGELPSPMCNACMIAYVEAFVAAGHQERRDAQATDLCGPRASAHRRVVLPTGLLVSQRSMRGDGMAVRVASTGVTYRRCQWCGEDFADYQPELYHQACAAKAAAEPAETPWWHSRGRSRKAGWTAAISSRT